jgi:hypothetical protein
MKNDVYYCCGIMPRSTSGQNTDLCSGNQCFYDRGQSVTNSYYIIYAVCICMVGGSLIFIGSFVWISVEAFKLARLRKAQAGFTGSVKFTVSMT